MIVWYLAILLLCLWGIRFRLRGFHEDGLSLDGAAMINGVSILLVFVAHIGHVLLSRMGYEMSGWGDAAYKSVHAWMGQLIVVSFLFFSGFGVMEQIKQKGPEYVANFPRRRIFKVWVNFAVAVCCFAIINLCFCTGVPIWHMIAALTCWWQIGNPSWYILCVLWCYSATYLAVGLLCKYEKFQRCGAWLLVAIAAAVYIGLVHLKVPEKYWWYNTIMVYPFGMMVSTYKESIIRFIRKWYWFCLLASIVLFVSLFKFRFDGYGLRFNALSCVFMTLVIIFAMKCKIGNSILHWCGKHVFPIYMYHCLFFLLARCLYHGPMTMLGAHLVVALTLVLTLIVARFYHHWEIRT